MFNFISKNPQVIKYDNETFYGFNELDSDIKKYYFFLIFFCYFKIPANSLNLFA